MSDYGDAGTEFIDEDGCDATGAWSDGDGAGHALGTTLSGKRSAGASGSRSSGPRKIAAGAGGEPLPEPRKR